MKGEGAVRVRGVSEVEPVGSKIFGPGPDLLSIFGPGTRTRTRLIKIVRPGPGPGPGPG